MLAGRTPAARILHFFVWQQSDNVAFEQSRNVPQGGSAWVARGSRTASGRGSDWNKHFDLKKAPKSGRRRKDRVTSGEKPTDARDSGGAAGIQSLRDTGMRFQEPPAKGDISTLPGGRHFYFALTRNPDGQHFPIVE